MHDDALTILALCQEIQAQLVVTVAVPNVRHELCNKLHDSSADDFLALRVMGEVGFPRNFGAVEFMCQSASLPL